MKDHPLADPAYFTADTCDIDAFAAHCGQAQDARDVPHASEIRRNVPLYDGPALRPLLAEPARRQTLMGEWARLLRHGAGVFVIRAACSDTDALDAATRTYLGIIEAERGTRARADHFGANDRVWNSLQKLCLADPALYARIFANPLIDAACEAWLGPNYQMTAQVNLVRPGGAAQTAHRDYHLGFQTAEDCARYPAHVHDLSPLLTLQGGIAHVDMSTEAGPTKLLPFSQSYRPGYAAYRLPGFSAFFEAHHVQIPMAKGDAIFFNPALFHAGGENRTPDVQRFVNLLQVGSAMGRTLENLDRAAMSLALYPVLLGTPLPPADQEAVISATAEGYPFPTNLDTDPPTGGLAPPSMADLMRRHLARRAPLSEFGAALAAQRQRQSP